MQEDFLQVCMLVESIFSPPLVACLFVLIFIVCNIIVCAFLLCSILQLDPELEFDREVYPLGLLPNVGVVVGVSQRMSFSASAEFPCFEPTPQAQTILHCLLRHLLQVLLVLASLFLS